MSRSRRVTTKRTRIPRILPADRTKRPSLRCAIPARRLPRSRLQKSEDPRALHTNEPRSAGEEQANRNPEDSAGRSNEKTDPSTRDPRKEVAADPRLQKSEDPRSLHTNEPRHAGNDGDARTGSGKNTPSKDLNANETGNARTISQTRPPRIETTPTKELKAPIPDPPTPRARVSEPARTTARIRTRIQSHTRLRTARHLTRLARTRGIWTRKERARIGARAGRTVKNRVAPALKRSAKRTLLAAPSLVRTSAERSKWYQPDGRPGIRVEVGLAKLARRDEIRQVHRCRNRTPTAIGSRTNQGRAQRKGSRIPQGRTQGQCRRST